MAELFVRHSLNAQKVAKFNLALKEISPLNNRGELIWVLEVGTVQVDINGDSIPPVYINDVSEEVLEDEIVKAVSSICDVIDWTVFDEDNYAPYVAEFSPSGIDVSIRAMVKFVLVDDLPSSGMDLSNMSVILNNGDVDFDITSEVAVAGDPYEYKITWLPPNING